jgi:hypothetical protein
MNIYLTELRAIDRATGGLKTFAGPRIEAPTWKLAEHECAVNYPYLKVIGVLAAEVDADDTVLDFNFDLN